MPIQDRNLEVGTRLVASYKHQRYVCTVEAEESSGGMAFMLEDGQRFKSPSAAGSAVMGGKAVNGWRFWSLEGQQPEIASEPSPGTKKGKKTIYRTPNQQQVPEGSTRWFCVSCMKGFIQEGVETPLACPEGHALEDLQTTGAAS